MKPRKEKHQELIDQGYEYFKGIYIKRETGDIALTLSDEELGKFKVLAEASGVDINDPEAVGEFVYKKIVGRGEK